MLAEIPAKIRKGWRKLLVSGLALTLTCSGIWAPITPKASAAAGSPMVVNSLEGPVTREEINSFKQYILSSSVGLPVSNIGNDFVYGPSGQNVEAMGYMYEISGDMDILDQMIKFSEIMLSARNNPDTGRVLWNGNRELAWPNKRVGEVNADGLLIEGYSGSENGDVIGHIAYAAKLILQNKSLWNKTVPYGDSASYGETYLQRAKKYVAELDKSMDTYMIPNFVKPDTLRQYWPSDPRWSTTGSAAPGSAIPWNQQMMINNGFMRLAECHELLGDDQPRVDLYDSIIKSSIDWFTSKLEPYQVAGHDVYKWWYVADYFGKVEDADGVHAANDIMGMTRAYDRGKYGVSKDTLIKLSNTIRYVISTGTGNFYCKVDGLPKSCVLTNLWSEYMHISPYDPDPAVYRLLANPYYMSTVLTSPIYFARIMWAKDHTSWTQNVDAELSPTWEAESYSSRSGRFTREVCDVCSKGANMQSPNDAVSVLNYNLNVTRGGNVYVHLLGSRNGVGASGLKVSLDAGPEVDIQTAASGWGWTTAEHSFLVPDGLHQLTLRSQGDGARIDKIVLSKSSHPPIESLMPKLTGIQINGVPIANFSPSTYTYTAAVPLGTKVIPTVSATSSHIVEIAQPQQVFGTAIITVKDRLDPYMQSKYEVQMTGYPIYGDVPDGFITFPIQGVTASAGYHASFPPASAIDGDLNTRYAAKGITHWLQVDLGEIKPVRSAVIAFLKGDVDRYTFDLQVSEDGVSWSTVFSGYSSRKTAGLEIFQFNQVNARYVKLNGKGNSKDTWNNVNEIYIGGVQSNVKPVSQSTEVTTPQNSAVSGTLSASDTDGNPLTYSIVTNGSKGTAVVTNSATGAFTYTPSPDVLGTDTFTFIANDGYENSDAATVTIRILDVTAPVTTNDGQSGWQKTAQTIHLTAVDEGSGVAQTLYSLNGSPFAVGNTAIIDSEGSNELKYYSIDTAGNQEAQKSVTVKIDKSGPIITPTVSMAVYVTDAVRLSFQTTDPFSGVKDTLIKLDGKPLAAPYAIEPLSLSLGDHAVVVTATDNLGNQNEKSFMLQVKMDIGHLDEALTVAKQKGWIKNEGVYKSLMALVNVIQKAPKHDVNNGLNALEKLIQLQRGIFIDEANSKKILEWISALKIPR